MDIQKVLIADDENHIREILKMYCEKEGFDVIEAADGAEAILKVQSYFGYYDASHGRFGGLQASTQNV